MNIEKYVKRIKDAVSEAGLKGCTVGVSGGVDSAVVVALCKRAFPENTIGISMPEKSTPKINSTLRAMDLCNNIDVLLVTCPLDLIIKDIPFSSSLARGNFMARIRMSILYGYAQERNYMVIGTDNRTENYIGYFTKYGDGGVDINPIGDLYKWEVFELAKELGLSDSIIKALPSAELWEGQTDEGEIGMRYNELDYIINIIEKDLPYDKDIADKVEMVKRMHRNTEHKRKMPREFVNE